MIRSEAIDKYGWLRVDGSRLTDEHGEPVVLHGMSSHGMQWYPEFAEQPAIAATIPFGANLFRIAMYTEEDGYMAHPDKLFAAVCRAADACIALGMYCIIDWHILADGNPQVHKTEALDFFARITERYGRYPNFLYEICNEPNSLGIVGRERLSTQHEVTWAEDVKPYAEEVIPVIRKNAPNAIILIGSPVWSQECDVAAHDPVDDPQVMYTCHFYAGTHGDALRRRILKALELGKAVFISEWGTSAADGSGGVFPKEADEWLAFLDRHGLSWANWSYGNRDETSAAIKPGYVPNGEITAEMMTESGKYVFEKM